MREAEHLRAQAARCRRIAAAPDEDPGMARDLEILARDYEQRAELAASRDKRDR
jgi:hypothetical protein